MKITIVEDHEDTLECLAAHLADEGHQVFSAQTMEEALGKIAAEPPDMLISDLGLPDGSGWELMERLQNNRPPFAIATSGFGSALDRVRSKETGFRYHLLKPIRLEQLDDIVAECLAEKEARDRR